jgi:hypothetical protein
MIYEDVVDVMKVAIEDPSKLENVYRLLPVSPRAGFLFGRDIEKYIGEIALLINVLRYTEAMVGRNAAHEEVEGRERDRARMRLVAEVTGGAAQRFGKYLDFSDWKVRS